MTAIAPDPSALLVPDSHATALQSATAYQQQFACVGGRELEILARPGAHSGLCVGLYENNGYDLQVPGLQVARVSIALTACQLSGAMGGARIADCFAQRNSLFLIPAGADARWVKPAASRHLNIYFQAEAFGGDDPDAPRMAQDLSLFNAAVPGIGTLAQELADELQALDPMATEAADSLAKLLLIKLSRFQVRAAQQANPLTPPLIARLRDYVVAHLAERILVADLAQVAGLSVYRFAHAFTEFCGRSPHQFVLCIRLARVLHMLRNTPMGIAEVALACGFASQQHLTRTMRQRLNLTPGGYRERVGHSGTLPRPR